MRNKRKTCLFMITMSAILGLMFTLATMVYADESLEPVKYQEASWNSTNKKVVYTQKSTSSYTRVTSEMDTSWGEGWYVVDSDVTIEGRISVSGTVNLILSDGCTFNAEKGINAGENKILNIYGQSAGTGELVAGTERYAQAGIGGNSNSSAGKITIHGGTVTAGGNGAAGIGGGHNGAGGTITIYGGTVTANGGSFGAGIGGGENFGGGTITIYGGTVTANGGSSAAGIGGGQSSASGTITINGGTIKADGGSSGAGIGGGERANGENITINGGLIMASSWEGAGIGGGYECSSGNVTINGGLVIAWSGGYGAGIGGGFYGNCDNVTINGGLVTAWSGSGKGIGFGCYGWGNGTLSVANGLKVYGGNDDYPTTVIDKVNNDYERFRSMIVDCTHTFTYAINDTTITAVCEDDACSLPDKKAEMTLVAPERNIYGDTDKSAEATLAGQRIFRSATRLNVSDILYSGRGNTIYDESNNAPEGFGDYKAKVIIQYDDTSYPMSVDYTISPTTNWTGSGTEEDPYVISTEDGWNTLSDLVNDGYTMEGLFFCLGDNIEVTRMVGTYDKPFSGSFSGIHNGKEYTLTFNADDAPEICAPFLYAKDAEFKDLHIAGTIKTIHKFAAGLIGHFDGTVKLTDCRCSIVIDSGVKGDGTHGGFIAAGEENGAAQFEGCIFDGKFLGPGTIKCGGFIGWANPTNKTYSVKDCLFAPEELTLRSNLFNFIRNMPGSTIIQNSYYTKNIDDMTQGIAAKSVTYDKGITVGSGDAIEYNVSGITASDTGLARGKVFYAGKDEVIPVTIPSVKSELRASAGTLTGEGTAFTLTMPDEDVRLYLNVDSITPSDDTADDTKVNKKIPVVNASKIKTKGNFKKKQMKITFPTKKSVTNYRVQYRLAGKKTWKSGWSAGKGTYTIKGLKKGSLCDIRIAGYVKQSDGSWLRSNWSKTAYRYMNTVTQKKPKAGKKRITVSWTKDKKSTGYQIRYSLKKSMSGAKTKTVKGKAKTKYTIKKLKKNKKYYIRIRAIKKKSGKTYLGILTSTRSAKVK